MDDYHNDDFERMEEDTLPSDVDDEGVCDNRRMVVVETCIIRRTSNGIS